MCDLKWTPGFVPYGADETAYLIVDRLTDPGNVREIQIERTDLEAVMADFMAGLVNDPRQVIAFNTRSSIGPRISPNRLQWRFKAVATLRVTAFPNTSGTSLQRTRHRRQGRQG